MKRQLRDNYYTELQLRDDIPFLLEHLFRPVYLNYDPQQRKT